MKRLPLYIPIHYHFRWNSSGNHDKIYGSARIICTDLHAIDIPSDQINMVGCAPYTLDTCFYGKRDSFQGGVGLALSPSKSTWEQAESLGRLALSFRRTAKFKIVLGHHAIGGTPYTNARLAQKQAQGYIDLPSFHSHVNQALNRIRQAVSRTAQTSWHLATLAELGRGLREAMGHPRTDGKTNVIAFHRANGSLDWGGGEDIPVPEEEPQVASGASHVFPRRRRRAIEL